MGRIIDEYGRAKFDLEEFHMALRKLADKMEERDIEPFDIYSVGGYVCLLKGKRNFTHDIDAYYNSNEPLNRAIYEVAQEVRNPEWLNNAVDIHRLRDMSQVPSLEELLSIEGSFEFTERIGRVNMFNATGITVIFMKLIAYRDDRKDKTDIEDIVSLAEDYGVEKVINSLKMFEPIVV